MSFAEDKGPVDNCRMPALGGRNGEGSTVADDLLSRAVAELPVLVRACRLLGAAKSGVDEDGALAALRERPLFRLRLQPVPSSYGRSERG